ncbi:hypothetical protein H8R17_42195 [Streptomyces sp. TRM68367]|nr:hypothetical protein [Streptomyces sp. TRM68367]
MRGPIAAAAFTNRNTVVAITDDQTVRTRRTDAKIFAGDICRLPGTMLSTRERQLYVTERYRAAWA